MTTSKTTKIYVDGFRIDTISTPKVCDDLKTVALTAKVKALLEEEGRELKNITAVPRIHPNLILIYTEL